MADLFWHFAGTTMEIHAPGIEDMLAAMRRSVRELEKIKNNLDPSDERSLSYTVELNADRDDEAISALRDGLFEGLFFHKGSGDIDQGAADPMDDGDDDPMDDVDDVLIDDDED